LKCSEDGRREKWDLGGQWVTDTQKNITRLLNELALETYTQYDTGRKLLELNGKLVTYNSSIPNVSLLSLLDLQLMLSKLNSNSTKVNTLRPFEKIKFSTKMDSTNMERFLFSSSFNKIAKSIVEVAFRAIIGLELSQVNALFGLLYTKSAGSFEALSLCEPGCAQEKKVKGGTQQISEKLLANVVENSSNKIIFNAETTEIKQNDLFVEVTVKDTTSNKLSSYRAKKIVCSIPINLYDKIDFSPDLPCHKWNVYRSCRMGNFGKFIVTYKRPFWRENGYSGEVVSDGSVLLLKNVDNKNESVRRPLMGPINCIFDATTAQNDAALAGFLAGETLVQWFG
jgi:monoamine oxidase